jgi:hypothetical protein
MFARVDSLARLRRFIARHAGRPWITPAPKLPPASDALAQLLAAALLDGGEWGYDLLIAAALEADRVDHQTWGPFLERTACLVQQARAAIWAGRMDPPAPAPWGPEWVEEIRASPTGGQS